MAFAHASAHAVGVAITSQPIPIGDATPVEFNFGQRDRVKVQVIFFSTLAAEPGDELAIGVGSRDVTVTTTDRMLSKFVLVDGKRVRLYEDTLDSDYAGGTQTLASRTWTEFLFADGSRTATVVAASNTDAGAVSYRIALSIPLEVP